MRILEQERHLRILHRAQEIEQVLRVEADLDGRAVVSRGNALFALSGFGNRRMNLHFVRRDAHADRARPLVGELRHAFDRAAQFFALQRHRVRLLFRQHAFVIRKIAGQLAAQQQAVAELEKQMIFVARKLHDRRRVGIARQFLQLLHRLLRQQRAIRAADARKLAELSTIARRWPSVATIARPPLRSTSSAPFSVKRDSSLEIEKMVLPIIDASTPIGISASSSGICGSSGKLSRDMPAMRVFDRPLPDWPNGSPESSPARRASGSSRT